MVEREGMRRGGCGWGGGVLGRWSLRRLLLDSPLVGRRLAHSVLEQGERAVRVGTEQAQARPTVQYIAEDEEGEVLDCPLCLSTFTSASMVRLAWCSHRCCEPCLRQYLGIEIYEARVPVNCPVCHENMHPSDVRRIVDNPGLYDKYEEFSVRRALAADPDTRWCPAPDCSFAVVASGCASCPKLTCLSPGCGASFCYHCKAAWHPTQTCDAARRTRQQPPRQPQPAHGDMEHGEVKPCPRCSVLIVKVEDGSCNHMVCCVCGAEFCWLCMKEVSDLHYLSPSGCTFWGKKPWSRKKKLLWQLGTLAGAPLGIAVVAGVALPALLVGLPLWAGRRAHRRLRKARPARRRAAVAAAVAAALVVSPLVAGLAVGIGVPILLFYVYGVVPVSLCRAGGCGGGERSEPAEPALELDATSRRLEPSIGDASLSAGSAQAEARAAPPRSASRSPPTCSAPSPRTPPAPPAPPAGPTTCPPRRPSARPPACAACSCTGRPGRRPTPRRARRPPSPPRALPPRACRPRARRARPGPRRRRRCRRAPPSGRDPRRPRASRPDRAPETCSRSGIARCVAAGGPPSPRASITRCRIRDDLINYKNRQNELNLVYVAAPTASLRETLRSSGAVLLYPIFVIL